MITSTEGGEVNNGNGGGQYWPFVYIYLQNGKGRESLSLCGLRIGKIVPV